MSDSDKLESFISEWALTGGSELANTQSFVNGLCALIGVDPPNGTLDLGDAPVAAPATIIPWPKTLAEQVSAVAAILAAAPAAQHPRDFARSIQGTNAKGVTPVLDALTAIGQAPKLADGRYAA